MFAFKFPKAPSSVSVDFAASTCPHARAFRSQGCAGTFADVGGYHHGRGDTYDSGARHYDDRGRDAASALRSPS